jgi:hypothetical protein
MSRRGCAVCGTRSTPVWYAVLYLLRRHRRTAECLCLTCWAWLGRVGPGLAGAGVRLYE